MEKYTLKNGIKAIIKQNNNTPRIALVLYSKIDKDENKSGLYYLLTQLLFKGTKNRTAEQIVNEFDENAIDITIEKKYDYIRFKLLCLNEDINHALEILNDIMENSTLEDIEKEVKKIKGEFESDLDSAKTRAQEGYYRLIFKNHPYGVGRKEIIEQLDTITKEDLVAVYNELKYVTQKNISIAGDIEKDAMIALLEKYFGHLKIEQTVQERAEVALLEEDIITTIKKEDANQAQIYKGWITPNVFSKDYPAIILLNTILGASGLSSRLFLELREKQGLAYTVRSISESYILGGCFTVYIATEPKNIRTSLDGFNKEINKIMTEVISEKELNDAKNSAIGRRQFYTETNLLEATLNGNYECVGLGYDFEENLIKSINSVTKEELIETAKRYFSGKSALCVLAPEKYLKEADLL
ncbi:insulinase family protein [bacterium]|nr:insulinase family protein [bacterium]